jgi:hypothetical protein
MLALVFIHPVVTVVVVIVDTSRIVVEHLYAHLVVAFIEEVHQAADLDVMGASELLPADVEVHLAFPIEQDLHGPPAEATSCFPQDHLGRFMAGKKFGELV